jgi:peptide/nickel transport system substrate-binding protein
MRQRGVDRTRSTTLCYLCALALAACTRGKVHEREPSVAQPTPAQAPANREDDDWQAGRLPASVAQGTPVAGGELVVAVDVEPPSLNPIVDNEWLGKRIVLHRVYEALIAIDPYDDPQYRHRPELAERWELSPDGRTYTFHLRPNVKWHDGLPFTAADVIATFDKIFDPKSTAVSTRSEFAELQSYRALDPATVVFVWKRAYFMALDALSDVVIQPAHVIASLTGPQYGAAASNRLSRAPIGTGPFKFALWESQSKIVLERNDEYWGRHAYLDRLTFRLVADGSVRLQLAERGEIDLLYRVKSDQWMHMDSPELRQHWNRSRFYSAKYHWIGWNARRPWFAEPEVRRALTMLVDRPGIIEHLLYGLPRPTTCHFYWASAACDPAQQPLPFDPPAALALLDAAGWTDHDGDGVRDRAGQPFAFALMLPSTSTETANWASKVKADFAHAGIELTLQRVEWSAFLKRLREHEFDAATLLWSGDARMDPTPVWHSSGIASGSNFVGYANPVVDRLIEQARGTLDPDTRNALFRQFGAIIHAEQPYTFLYTPPELDLIHKRVKGARANLYWWQFEDMWLDPTQTKG